GMDGQDLVERGQLQDHVGLRAGARDPKIPTRLANQPDAADDGDNAPAVEEAHTAHVHNKTPGTRIQEVPHLRPEHTGGAGVKAPLGTQHVPPAFLLAFPAHDSILKLSRYFPHKISGSAFRSPPIRPESAERLHLKMR